MCIRDRTPGADVELRYTTDGTIPTELSTLYQGPFLVEHTTNFKIVAFKPGWSPSGTKLANYVMNFGTLSAPVIDQPDGTYTGSVTVTFSTTAPGVVHYTTALGTATPATPLISSPTTTPKTFNQSTKVRARSFHGDYTPSVGEVTRTYTVIAHTPTLSAASGSYAPGSIVTITAGDSLDTLRMTIDGTDPTSTSPIVASGTSILLGDFTLKVRAIRPSANDSAVASATYTLNAPLGPGSASAGGSHSVLVTPDGRVYAFGENGSGQLGDDTFIDRLTPTVLNTITGVTSISSSLSHTLARTWDGQAYSWGSNLSGRLGDGTATGSRKLPYHIPTLTNVTAVAVGDAHNLALTSDGHVYSWGENGNGQLGLGSTIDAYVPTEIPSLTNIVAIAAGDIHSLALNASGQIFAWGSNGNSRLGDGTTTQRTSPVPITLPDVVAIAAGASHSMAMTGSGSVFTWGLGTSGQLGHGSTTSYSTPHLLAGMHASAIAAGDNHSAAIRGDGVLVAWGSNASGQVGDGSITQRNAPAVVSGPGSVSMVSLGDLHSMAVTPTGELWTWGDFASGRLGDNSTVDRPTPASVMSGIANWTPAAPTVSAPSVSYTHLTLPTILRV